MSDEQTTGELLDQLERDYLALLGPHLRRLKRDADAAIEELSPLVAKGDLRSETSLTLSEEWRGLRIAIKGGDPDNQELIAAVREGLYRRGWYDIDFLVECVSPDN